MAQVRCGKVHKMNTSEKTMEIGGTSPTNDAKDAIEIQRPYRVCVEVQGVAPFLFHRWSNESVESKSKAKKGSAERKTDDIESYIYRNDAGIVCIPGEMLRMAIVLAAKYEQDPRSPRKSMMDLCKAAVVSLTDLAPTGFREPNYIDRRRVTIQRNSITRSRPALKEGWRAGFILMVNLPEYLDPAKLNYLIQMAGRINGLGDFRPTYGRFIVTKFKVLDD